MVISDEIKAEIRRLNSTTGFLNLFFEKLTQTKTQAEAYREAEKEYQSIFGENRYSSYDSFRKTKNRLIKKG